MSGLNKGKLDNGWMDGSWTRTLSVSEALIVVFILFYRLLCLEKHSRRLVVHFCPVWSVDPIWPRAGDPAAHDTCEPQGGLGVPVILNHSWFPRDETNPMHRVHADQRAVLPKIIVLLWSNKGGHLYDRTVE